jgi:hypothetical protein
MSLWMIRHADLTFTRPIPQDLLVSKIEAGEVIASDEICSGDGYWFSIQEVDEVKKFFGNIRLKALLPSGSDVTSATDSTPTMELRKKVIQENTRPTIQYT